jgi:hypothetical protein
MKAHFSRLLPLALAGGVCVAPLAASAQSPSYSAPDETIRGTISSVQNLNHLFVADDRGYTDDITLRSGADVQSNGARLEPGARVTISGTAAGKTFLATRISTDGPPYYPVPVYYPAPVYYGPAYAYRPYSPVSIGLFFHFR